MSSLLSRPIDIIFFNSRNTNQIPNAVDETYFKLREWSNTLLPPSHRDEEPETLSSLDLSIDGATWILYSLRELYSISYNEEEQRITGGGKIIGPPLVNAKK